MISTSVSSRPTKTFAPIRSSENWDSARDGVSLASVGLDPDSSGVLDGEQVVYDFKSLFALGEVDTADVHAGFKLALAVVAQESEDRDDGAGCDVESQLVLQDGELLDELGKALGEVGSIGVQLLCGFSVECFCEVG